MHIEFYIKRNGQWFSQNSFAPSMVVNGWLIFLHYIILLYNFSVLWLFMWRGEHAAKAIAHPTLLHPRTLLSLFSVSFHAIYLNIDSSETRRRILFDNFLRIEMVCHMGFWFQCRGCQSLPLRLRLPPPSTSIPKIKVSFFYSFWVP